MRTLKAMRSFESNIRLSATICRGQKDRLTVCERFNDLQRLFVHMEDGLRGFRQFGGEVWARMIAPRADVV